MHYKNQFSPDIAKTSVGLHLEFEEQFIHSIILSNLFISDVL